jgi:hypothetical protein
MTLCNAKQTCQATGIGVKKCKNNPQYSGPYTPWGCEIGNGGCFNSACTCPDGEWCGYSPSGGGKICRNNLFIIFLNFCIPDHLLMKL